MPPSLAAAKKSYRISCNRQRLRHSLRVLAAGRLPLSDSEPITFRPRQADVLPTTRTHSDAEAGPRAAFDRIELNIIMDIYGRKVAQGEWRDYALDMLRDRAVFSIFRRASEVPLYRIEKHPKLARKQGAFAVIAASGHIMKRGNDLRRVLSVLDVRRLEVVST